MVLKLKTLLACVLCMGSNASLASVAFGEESNYTSLCEIPRQLSQSENKLFHVRGFFKTSYHVSKLTSEKCENFWYGLSPSPLIADSHLAAKYLESMEDQERMKGRAYYIEFTGHFKRYSSEAGQGHSEFTGYFEVENIKTFVEIKN